MELKPGDLHLCYSEAARKLKVFNDMGRELFECECRNSTVNNGTYGHFGNCPPGEFVLGHPVFKNTVPFGPWFISVNDYDGHTSMQHWGRAGIGIHGGGSGLADPFADHQGWTITEGCLRCQNIDLKHLVQLVSRAQKAGRRCYITVSA
jgi:hypothetical protein